MKKIDEMDEEDLMSEGTFIELMDEEDIIERTRTEIKLGFRARSLGIKTDFDELLRAYKRTEREMQQEEKKNNPVSQVEGYTDFQSDGKYDNMLCGSWIANENGIFAQNDSSIDHIACYHPIIPVERLKNLETGEEQLKIAYKRNNKWSEIIVPKIIVSSASKIVALAAQGVSVTSESAKLLVRFLSDVENKNDDFIKMQYSTGKLGWIKDDFIPYDQGILFDGDSRFKALFESVTHHGSYDKWKDHMKEIRASGRLEVKLMLASSFASILVKKLEALPFIVDLWGETEGGKTVALMVAASVWANPAESQYIGDFKSTEVALEAKSDMLNNLPLILDDTSKRSEKVLNNFEGIVYDLCSGKGKSRSNKELGINRENHWTNCTLTNGERPLNGYVSQGGAINRILEIEAQEKIFDDPQKTSSIVKRNYGYAGKEFVKILKELDSDKINEIQQDFQNKLFNDQKMQKQSISLSIILTADKIVTDYIFKDGKYISLNEAKQLLINRNDLSDNERCYRYLIDKVVMNPQRFGSKQEYDIKCEQWGLIEDDYAVIFNTAFEKLCKEEHYSKKSFLSWAKNKGILKTDKGRYDKNKRIGTDNRQVRCVFLRIGSNDSTEKLGFDAIPDEVLVE